MVASRATRFCLALIKSVYALQDRSAAAAAECAKSDCTLYGHMRATVFAPYARALISSQARSDDATCCQLQVTARDLRDCTRRARDEIQNLRQANVLRKNLTGFSGRTGASKCMSPPLPLPRWCLADRVCAYEKVVSCVRVYMSLYVWEKKEKQDSD